MIRRSPISFNVNLPNATALDNQVLFRQLLLRKQSGKMFKSWTGQRITNWFVAAGVIAATGFVFVPFVRQETTTMLGSDKTATEDTTLLQQLTTAWWENEWRTMRVTWRRDEVLPGFHLTNFSYIQDVTGRDLLAEAKQSKAVKKALVPLCGDSPIVKTLVNEGFCVDAVDSSETAIRSCVERTEASVPPENFARVTLHWKDFFAAELWNGILKPKSFDLVYDRQALSAIAPHLREDYAYLLKQSLRDDGVLFVEGVFRTGRVKGNKTKGPPFSLSWSNLEELFPAREGYVVQCRDTEDDAVKHLTAEMRVLRRVPKELHYTTFPCVIYKKQ